jgi:hypothetical protein
VDKCTVLIEDWQMQCCGEPFSIGSYVNWLVLKYYKPFIYHKDVDAVNYCYEHHSSDWKKLFKINGSVITITACYCFFIPDITDPTRHRKIKTPGGATQPVTQADGWDEDIGEQEFGSYVVCIDNVSIRPAKESEVTYC